MFYNIIEYHCYKFIINKNNKNNFLYVECDIYEYNDKKIEYLYGLLINII